MTPYKPPLWLKCLINLAVCLLIVYLITGCALFTPMTGGRCIDKAIISAQEIEREGGKSLLAYGMLWNGEYHIHAMWWNGEKYQLVFPDPGFKRIERYYTWVEAKRLWREK